MTYILMIWTVVAMAGDRHQQAKSYDWRPLGEFHLEDGRMNKTTAKEMCEQAAQELGLKKDAYRCVRAR